MIVALLSYPGHQEVVTVKPGRSERKAYGLGDAIGGGVLRLVHPYGAVIGIDGVDYVYPPRAALDNEDQRIPAGEVPQVAAALALLNAEDEPDEATEAQEEGADSGAEPEAEPGAETQPEVPDEGRAPEQSENTASEIKDDPQDE